MESINTILTALRNKIAYIAIVFLAGSLTSFRFAGSVIGRINDDLLPEGALIVYISPLEVIILKIKLALISGLLFTLPLIIHFIGRAIFEKVEVERSFQISRFWICTSIIVALIAFLLGASYAYFLMLPLFINYLYLSASASSVSATYSIFKFVSFAVEAIIIFGLIFELPILLTILNRYGIVHHQTLVTYRRHIYILFLIAGAAITPPDVISQIMVAVPLIILFEISLVIVRIIGRRACV